MRINKKGALAALVTTGGLSYGAYEFSDSLSPLAYNLKVPIIPTLEFSEDIRPSVNSSNENNPKTENIGAQHLQSKSLNVMTSLPNTRSAVDSKDPKLEKEKNRDTAAVESPPEVSRPAKEAEDRVVQTKVIDAVKPTPQPTVATAEPTKVTKPTMKPTAKPNPPSQEQVRKEMQMKLQETHKKLASSYGMTFKNSYDAQGLDNHSGDPNSTVKVKTFVAGEDAGYINTLWTSSIAIKHRRYWNLAPDEDPSWDQQLAAAQKRFKIHANGGPTSKIMYDSVFGDFTIYAPWSNYAPFLNKKNLATVCKRNLARTPWGTWWSTARARYWILLWDFCAKPEWHKKGIPWGIDYWYRGEIGSRSDDFYKLS